MKPIYATAEEQEKLKSYPLLKVTDYADKKDYTVTLHYKIMNGAIYILEEEIIKEVVR